MQQGRIEPGGRIGRYEVIEHLASGGMADVYLCRRSGIGGFQRQVVLKTIKAGLAEDDRYMRMFLDEARIAGSANHMNVAAVYEAEEADGVAFLVMEYVSGPSMSRLLRFADKLDQRNRLGAAWLISGAARGLHHVHNATASSGATGLVHRDVSLDNILASRDGIAKVIDFGIALAKERMSHTETDVLKGKLSYVAPEQLSTSDIDFRADIFALGVCLYRATLGVPPFADPNPHVLLKVRLNNEFKRPREIDPEFPEVLERVILRAMAFDRTERQPSAGQLANEIDAWIRSVQPDFGATDVAAWIGRCFRSEADFRPRSRGVNVVSRSGSGLQVSSASASSSSGVSPTSLVPSVRTNAGASGVVVWGVAIGGGVLAGLAVLAAIALLFTPSGAPTPVVPAVPIETVTPVSEPVVPPAAPVPAEQPPAPAPLAVEPAQPEPANAAPPKVAAPKVAPPAAEPPPPPAAIVEPPASTPVVPPTAGSVVTRSEATAAVAAALVADGWAVARDWKNSGYTIDIVATRGKAVRFVDVKVLASAAEEVPENRRRLRLAGEFWLRQNPGYSDVSHVVGAVAPGDGAPTVRWVP